MDLCVNLSTILQQMVNFLKIKVTVFNIQVAQQEGQT
jgi:hypothetical protein